MRHRLIRLSLLLSAVFLGAGPTVTGLSTIGGRLMAICIVHDACDADFIFASDELLTLRYQRQYPYRSLFDRI